MLKKERFLTLALLFSFFLGTYSLASNPPPDPDTIEKAKNEYLANICAEHGGVNCSIINKNASVVCNDGTIDESLSTIYAISQCQKTIENIAAQQSDFMAQSGCYPPSEMGCFNEQSYQNLYKILSNSGLSNSELGKYELSQCRQQINEYVRDNKNYKQCLINHGQSKFEPSGKIVLPILKTVFCPLFYGDNASYDAGTDLCLCARDYFMDSERCVEANKICQSKYGPNVFAKNGNCSRPQLSSTDPTTLTSPAEQAKTTPTVQPQQTILSTAQQLYQTPNFINQLELEENTPRTSTNFTITIFSKLASIIKTIFKLF